MDVKYKFNKIDELFSFEVKTFDDCIDLSKKILDDENQIIKTFLSSNDEDFELIHDFIELIENIKEYGNNKYNKQYKELIYLIVSTCLSLKNETLSSKIIQRLYRRGFVSNLVDSYIKYYSNVFESNQVEDFEKKCVLGNNETSLSLCCNVIRYLSKFLFVKNRDDNYYLCIDSYTNYNIMRRTISYMFYSCMNVNKEWNYVALSKLFHPLSRLYLPCLVLYVLIDEMPNECKIGVLSSLSSFYSDSELMKTISSNDVSYLAGCISRLLVCTKVNNDQDLCTISGFLTRAITSGLSTLDPFVRESAMTIAESYSDFTYNNSENKDQSLLFKFDRDYKLDSPSMFNLAAFRSKLVVNSNNSTNEEDNKDSNEEEEDEEMEEGEDTDKDDEEEGTNNNKDNLGREEKDDKKNLAEKWKGRLKESDDEGANNPVTESYGLQKETTHNQEEKEDNKDENKNDNETFLEFIFKGVPEIDVKTVKGYVKEGWIRPPQHIVQCFERLLSKPARGDVDFECLIASSLDRVEEETVENRILRISQTLLYLPQVINKNESIMEKYCIPLSNILIKLDDLDLYREKIGEIVKMNENQSLDYGSGSEEIAFPTNFVSKDPEILVLVSLVLLTYHCPASITQFYTSHLFDSEYSLGIRITMLLCIQYTAVAFNGSLDPDQLVDKIIQDTTKLAKGTESISGLKSCNPLEDCEPCASTQIVFTAEDESLKPHTDSFQISTVHVRRFNNQTMSLLLDSLDVYLKRKQSDKPPMDEDVVVGIFETLVILVSSSFVDQEILRDLDDVIQYFATKPVGQRLRSTLEMVSMVLSTVPNYRLCV